MNDKLERLVICPECGGEGVVDSGGQTPWGAWINVPCPLCNGKPITNREVQTSGGINNGLYIQHK